MDRSMNREQQPGGERLIIAEYNPEWPRLFEEERAGIQEQIGTYLDDIQHIGSTAVPGLGAKPIIDIMVVIPRIEAVASCVPGLEKLDYHYMGEYGIAGRHYFYKPANASPFEHQYHLHMLMTTHHQYLSHILFRDYLRMHPEALTAYQQLKEELATRYISDRDSYTDSKSQFVSGILALAHSEIER
ncbi:GrpB family protein [Ktedonobacteria bacterium brp13]|nr:GrpB family protein [Ktedonobacteria bacterium brp13]